MNMYGIKGLCDQTSILKSIKIGTIMDYDYLMWFINEMQLYEKYPPTETKSYSGLFVMSYVFNWNFGDYYVSIMLRQASMYISHGHGNVYDVKYSEYTFINWDDSSKVYIQSILENFNEIKRNGG